MKTPGAAAVALDTGTCTHSELYTLCTLVCTVYSVLYSILYTVHFNVLYTLYSVLYSVQCSVQCTLITVPSAHCSKHVRDLMGGDES